MKHEQLQTIRPRWPFVKSVERGVDQDGNTVLVLSLTDDGMTTTERFTLNRVEAVDLYHAIGAAVPEWT